MTHPAAILILLGLLLVAIGVAWWLVPAVPWLGRLPGDIRWDGERGTFYFPIVTCLLLSALLTGLLWLVRFILR